MILHPRLQAVVSVLAYFALAFAPASAQSVVYVDDHASGANDGSSWCDAFNYLQDPLAAAAAPGGTVTEIRVAQGVYKPDLGASQLLGDREATFQLLNGVAIRGGYAGCGAPDPDARDVAAHEVVLSGDLVGNDNPNNFPMGGSFAENSYHVVTGSGTDESAVLDGFTIIGGNANDGPMHDSGGGMKCYEGSPTVVACTFTRNRADHGGGAFLNYGYYGSGESTLIGCTFRSNSAGLFGGGLYNYYGSPILTASIFIENHSEITGGALHDVSYRPTVIRDCLFAANLALSGGGLNTNNDTLTLTGSVFVGNSATNGGGMVNAEASPSVSNCMFIGNVASNAGGAVLETNWGSARLTNCTLVQNAAAQGGGLDNTYSFGYPILTNCILWGNSANGVTDEPAQIYDMRGSAVVNYSCIEGLTGSLAGLGNIGVDPLFADPDGADDDPLTFDDNDYSLSAGSPGIGTGNNQALPPDSADLDADGDKAELVPLDLNGERRVQGCVVDMGAFEFASSGPGIIAPPEVLLVWEFGTNVDGLTWTTAYDSLQDALAEADVRNGDGDSANDVSELWVAEGTYRPDRGEGQGLGERFATFQLRNGLGLYGGFACGDAEFSNSNPASRKSILSGDLAGDDVSDLSAFLACFSGEMIPLTPGCEGFDLDTDNDVDTGDGGISENSYHVVTANLADNTALVNGFTITAGNADGAFPHSNGGGIRGLQSNVVVQACRFVANSAGVGGGAYWWQGTPTVSNCLFRSNYAFQGAGMFHDFGSTTFVINCTFTANSASYGGGTSISLSTPAFTNCVFNGNTAVIDGGAVAGATDTTSFTNCTLVGNSANEGGGIKLYANDPALTNCILWGNSDIGGVDESAQIHLAGGNPVINHTCIQGLSDSLGGLGNIGVDPLLADPNGLDGDPSSPDDNDYSLSAASPCLDVGNDEALPLDTADLDDDGDTSELIPMDIAGQSRVICTVDMGAFERSESWWAGPDGGAVNVAAHWESGEVPYGAVALFNDDPEVPNTAVVTEGHAMTCVDIGAAPSASQSLQVAAFQVLEIRNGLNLQPGGILYATVESGISVTAVDVSVDGEIRIDPQGAVVFEGPLVIAGLLTLYGGAILADTLTISSGAGIVHGYGDIMADLINDNSATYIADTQVIGDYANNGTTTIQNGVLTIIGSLIDNGTIIGDVNSGSPRNSSQCGLTILGDYRAGVAASLQMPAPDLTLKIGGSFDVAINDAARFDLTVAELQMIGLADDIPQTLEMLAANVGACVDVVEPVHFVIGTLRIGPTPTRVTLVDHHINKGGEGNETLYIQNLILDPDTTLDLAGMEIYYGSIEPPVPFRSDTGVTFEDSVGGGCLIPIGESVRGDWNRDGAIGAEDYAFFVECFAGPSSTPNPAAPMCSDLCLQICDFNKDGSVDLSDYARFADVFER